MFLRIVLVSAFFALAARNLHSQAITIEGVVDRTSYNDVASFRVVTNAGFSYLVTLNGVPVPAGVTNRTTRMDYYDLAVTRTNDSTSAVITAITNTRFT